MRKGTGAVPPSFRLLYSVLAPMVHQLKPFILAAFTGNTTRANDSANGGEG
jgi:hypothetical protein